MNYSVFRDGGAVKRYHVVRTIGEQTVAEHSFNVACLLTAFVPDVSVNLLKAALYHDLAEQTTGDVPATVKWRSPELRAELAKEERAFEVLTQTNIELTNEEELALKIADTLELVHYCLEQVSMGNKNMLTIADRGVRFLFTLPVYNSVSNQMIAEAVEILERV